MAYACIIKMNQLQTGHNMYVFGKLEQTRSVSLSCTVLMSGYFLTRQVADKFMNGSSQQ